MDENAIRQRLEKAFVTDEEMRNSGREWHDGAQTFPVGQLILRN